MVHLYDRDAREVEAALDLVLSLVEIGSNLPAAAARVREFAGEPEAGGERAQRLRAIRQEIREQVG
jgi:pilus assembly protein TadC